MRVIISEHPGMSKYGSAPRRLSRGQSPVIVCAKAHHGRLYLMGRFNTYKNILNNRRIYLMCNVPQATVIGREQQLKKTWHSVVAIGTVFIINIYEILSNEVLSESYFLCVHESAFYNRSPFPIAVAIGNSNTWVRLLTRQQ